jgi:hypothetical protein
MVVERNSGICGREKEAGVSKIPQTESEMHVGEHYLP